MKRAERREKTRVKAEHRYNEMKNNWSMKNFLPDTIGFFKKNNPFTIKKTSSRLWNKIDKEKKEKIKELKRNGNDCETSD